MNRQFFAGVAAIIVATVCVSVPECYGWTEPLYIDSDWELYTPVGTTVEVHAWVVEGGPVSTWVWSWGSGVMDGPPSSTGDSSTSRGHFNSPGRYSVWVSAYGEGGSDDARTYVWNVDVVIDTPSSFPAHVAQGQSLALGCTPLGATGGSFAWSKASGPGNVTFTPTIGTENPSFSADQAGDYTVQVLYSKGATVSDTSGTIRVVAVTQVISSKTVACIGENVTFGALTYPPNCAPYVTITWSGGQNPATGSGSQWTTNWSTPGPKTVIATCGSSNAQKQVKVVEVASLLPNIGTEFDDGDNNPDTKSFAVSGRVFVTVTATPEPSILEEELPSCWSLTGGTGTGKLTRTVNMDTLINAGQTFSQLTCTCGSSSKTTKMYVENPISIHASFSFDKHINGAWYEFGGSAWIGGFYDTRFHGWDSCLTSMERKFDHMHATANFPFYAATFFNGVPVDAYASDSDHYWTRTSYGPGTYELVSSSTFSQNCHGHSQGKGYWINNVVPLIEDDYVQTAADGEFKYSPDHSIKIDIFYPNGNICTTSEKMQYSGVYTRTFLPPGAPPGTMYVSK